MKRNATPWLILAAAALVAGCSEEEPVPVYQKVAVAERDIVVSASAAGTVEPVTTVDVKSKASGEIMEVRVETGDVVTPGQLLVKVDPRVPRNALQQAEADLEVARAQLTNAQAQRRRAEELYKTQSITETEWEQASLAAANANAQLVRAQRNLEDARIAFEDTEVKAPGNGVIIEKNVETGTVIQSATQNVGGGTVLLKMANLDTVQVRALVDETDIGKIQPGLAVTITVDAYPNRPFRGEVLKIEPQATVQQNVTMFPVLVRIANREGLLRPGMNAEVEVHVGSRENVLAIPNAALRTTRDVASAAMVLGLDPDAVQEQLAQARRAAAPPAPAAAATAEGPAVATMARGGNGGREVPLPAGVSAEQIQAVMQKMRSGGFESLTPADRALLQQMRGAGGGRPGGAARRQEDPNSFLFGGDYIVFALRDGKPTPVPIRTGLTDLDYSEVVSGLTAEDTVLILPSASLVASQQEMQERMQRMNQNALPGVRQSGTAPSGGAVPRGNR
jgi:HlyD family secretion protein